jgi:hypothetical protein
MIPEKLPTPTCAETLSVLDIVMDNGPVSAPVREAAERHLAECPDCAAERDLRHRLRSRMRAAARQTVAGESFEQRIQAAVHMEAASKSRFRPHWSLAAAAAAVVISLSGVVAYQLGHLRLTTGAQDSYIAGISEKVSWFLRAGLKDHVHCTVFRKFPKQLPPPAELVQAMEPNHRELGQIVKASLPEDYRVIQAHTCRYLGRHYIHMAMRTADDKLVSLILSRKQDGETLSGAELPHESVQRFQVTSFESRDYMGYVVSDMDPDRNNGLAKTLSEPVTRYLDSHNLQG